MMYLIQVEWFWNGKPLKTGSRFRTFCDFGFVILEISPVYPEDSGEYSCRAFNDYGEAVTTATMKVQGNYQVGIPNYSMAYRIQMFSGAQELSCTDLQEKDK